MPEEKQKKLSSPWSITEAALVRKDLISIWGNGGMRMMLILLPIILVVVIPVIFMIAISLMPVSAGDALPSALLKLLPEETAKADYRAAMFTVFTNLLAPMFYLTVPILCSISAASAAFISEKENHTLESLMLTSLPYKTIFSAKVSGSAILAIVISFFSFIAFLASAAVGDAVMAAPFFFNFDWFITVFLLMPAISIFCVLFIALLSRRIRTTGESLQLMGYFILVVALCYLMQFCGLFAMNAIVLFVLALLLIIADFIMYNLAMKKFTPENMLTPGFFSEKTSSLKSQ